MSMHEYELRSQAIDEICKATALCDSAALDAALEAHGFKRDTLNDDDKLRVLEIRDKEGSEQVMERVRKAIQLGDSAALRSAFQGRGAFLIANNSWNTERFILWETLAAPVNVSLDPLGAFFRNFGRFHLKDGQCVYSVLIEFDMCKRVDANSEEEVLRWTDRMAQTINYMVNTLDMPIVPHEHHAQTFAETSRSRYYNIHLGAYTLPQMAWENYAWASWAAFQQHVTDSHFLPRDANEILSKMLEAPYKHQPYTSFFFKRYLPDLTDDQLEALPDHPLVRQLSDDESNGFLHDETERRTRFLQFIHDEMERRTRTRIHMRALFMLPKPDAPGSTVQSSDEVAHTIQAIAHSESRF